MKCTNKECPYRRGSEDCTAQEGCTGFTPETNFERHFGTAEEAVPYLIQYDDYYDCYRTAFDAVGYDTKKEALKASLAWLNAPAEDEE